MKKILIFGSVVFVALIAIFIYHHKTYVGERVDPIVYFDEFVPDTPNMVYEDKRIDFEEPIRIEQGKILVSCNCISHYMNDRIFYDENEKVVTLTNAKEVVRLYEGENQITFANVTGNYMLKDGYIESTLLNDLFGINVVKNDESSLYVATCTTLPKTIATLKRTTDLQTHPAKNKEVVKVVERLKKGEEVTTYDEENGYVRVRSQTGIIGYVPTKALKNAVEVSPATVPTVEEWQINPIGKTVRLVWDNFTVKTEVDWSAEKYARIKNINVISPAWFDFSKADGTLSDLGTTKYVENAHQRGIKVWAMLRHNFEQPTLTEQILTSTKKRQYVINQLIALAKKYDLDGINIDIENIQTETSRAWVEFIRELYPLLKAEGLIVSVDIYTPSSWSGHYEREKVSKSCDYFMLMAYDQHWLGSEKAGSVSELPWAKEGVEMTLEEVPKEKLVLGIPLYTRLWAETASGLETRSYSMVQTKQLLATRPEVPIYDEKSGLKYIEYHKDNKLYKLWIEDTESLKKRLDFVKEYDLAGIAAWRLGYETADVWDILEEVK